MPRPYERPYKRRGGRTRRPYKGNLRRTSVVHLSEGNVRFHQTCQSTVSAVAVNEHKACPSTAPSNVVKQA
jgi:hypothetical protein